MSPTCSEPGAGPALCDTPTSGHPNGEVAFKSLSVIGSEDLESQCVLQTSAHLVNAVTTCPPNHHHCQMTTLSGGARGRGVNSYDPISAHENAQPRPCPTQSQGHVALMRCLNAAVSHGHESSIADRPPTDG